MKIYQFFSTLRDAMNKPGRAVDRAPYPCTWIKEETTGRVFSPITLVCYEVHGVVCPPDKEEFALFGMDLKEELEDRLVKAERFPDALLREPMVAIVAKKAFGQRGQFIGAKVGISHSVACSDGYLGQRLPMNKPEQVFDQEAERLIAVAKSEGKSLAIQSTEALEGLQLTRTAPYKLHYFGERLKQLAEPEGITICEVSPKNLSVRCELCGLHAKRPRYTQAFICNYCGHETYVSLLVARNIARKASNAFPFHPKD